MHVVLCWTLPNNGEYLIMYSPVELCKVFNDIKVIFWNVTKLIARCFLVLVAVFSKRKRKHVLIETLVKVWENSKKLCVSTAFLVLPNFHSCFYNSIETRYMFSISKILLCRAI